MNVEIAKELIENGEIAKTIIEQMGSQVDLLVTLATAIYGGLIALFIQILIHNREHESSAIKFNPKTLQLIVLCLLFEGLSICSAYFARATITALTPAIFRIDTSSLQSWSDAPLQPGAGFALKLWPTIQFLFFFLGILMLFLFMTRNRQIIGGKKL
jgi:hypothetical protein